MMEPTDDSNNPDHGHPGAGGGGKKDKKNKRERKEGGPKIHPHAFDYIPPRASMCYRDGPKLNLLQFPREDILKLMKCCNCKMLAPAESRQCTLGHIICPPCMEAVQSCPKMITHPPPSPGLLLQEPVRCDRAFLATHPHCIHKNLVESFQRFQRDRTGSLTLCNVT